jgi:hypothetical protein
VLEGLLNFKTGLRDIYISWLLSLAKALHDDGKVLILVIPPGEAFDAKDFNQLAPHIDRFSLMTYGKVLLLFLFFFFFLFQPYFFLFTF